MEEITDLMERQEVCVLATTAGNMPHCSLMAYICDPGGKILYMVTHTDTRKYGNMRANPAVSLLIDSRLCNQLTARNEIKALTVKGRWRELDDEEQLGILRQRFVRRHPHLKEFAEDKKAVIFAVEVDSFQLQRSAVDGVHELVGGEEAGG